MMGKIIRCDFRRTARQEKMDRILADTYHIADLEKQKNPNITEREIFNLPRLKILNAIYTKLYLEEEEWGNCKWWK